MKKIVLIALMTLGPSAMGSGKVVPNRNLTPGLADSKISLETLCGESTSVRRHVTASMKQKILKKYGVTPGERKNIEIDHRVPLCAGGVNAEENLWAEPYAPKLGAHEKDWLELHVCEDICKRKISIHDAQKIFLGNWWTEYDRRRNAGGKKK
jgi:hypothetical protein